MSSVPTTFRKTRRPRASRQAEHLRSRPARTKRSCFRPPTLHRLRRRYQCRSCRRSARLEQLGDRLQLRRARLLGDLPGGVVGGKVSDAEVPLQPAATPPLGTSRDRAQPEAGRLARPPVDRDRNARDETAARVSSRASALQAKSYEPSVRRSGVSNRSAPADPSGAVQPSAKGWPVLTARFTRESG